MRRGEIQRQVTSTNLWRTRPNNWHLDDPMLRDASRAPFQYSAEVLSDLSSGGLYLLRGPRCVGKSVEMKLTIQRLLMEGADPRCVVYLAVDGWTASDLDRGVEAVYHLTPRGSHVTWFVDEITSIQDGWPARIEWLRHNHPRFSRDTVVLTGSSSSSLDESLGAHAEPRRSWEVADRVLLPFGFRTFADLIQTEMPSGSVDRINLSQVTPSELQDAVLDVSGWMHKLIGAWDTYLIVGGFPRAVAEFLQTRLPDTKLLRTLRRIIGGDAYARARISELHTDVLLQLLQQRIRTPVNVDRLAREIDTATNTARRHLARLRDSFVTWPLHQATVGREGTLRPHPQSQSKVYFTDPAYFRLGTLNAALDMTKATEQQLGVALSRSFERHDGGSYLMFDRLMFGRTASGAEIDFVGPGLGDWVVESKFSENVRLGRVGQTIRSTTRPGIVVTADMIDLSNPNLLAIPAGVLAYLIDN